MLKAPVITDDTNLRKSFLKIYIYLDKACNLAEELEN